MKKEKAQEIVRLVTDAGAGARMWPEHRYDDQTPDMWDWRVDVGIEGANVLDLKSIAELLDRNDIDGKLWNDRIEIA